MLPQNLRTQTIRSFTLGGPIGVDAMVAEICVNVDAAAPASFKIAGVSPIQAKEISVRVRSAIMAAGTSWPGGVEARIDVAPGTSAGSALDLALALAVLGVPCDDVLVCGELGLDGSVRPVRGVFCAAQLARQLGIGGILVPAANTREALDALEPNSGTLVYSVGYLRNAREALAVEELWGHVPPRTERRSTSPDFTEARGLGDAIAGIERAVVDHALAVRAGDPVSRVLVLEGPPGSGKTLLGRRIVTAMPALSRPEMQAVTRVYSAAGLATGLVEARPFRAPHHTISAAAMVGGNAPAASWRRPGELQLATLGVLFLDEIHEFPIATLEVVREALRATAAALRPLVVATASPCPCGWHGSAVRACTCTADAIKRHAARVAKATTILGIATTVRIEAPSRDALRESTPGPASSEVRARVEAAIAR